MLENGPHDPATHQHGRMLGQNAIKDSPYEKRNTTGETFDLLQQALRYKTICKDFRNHFP